MKRYFTYILSFVFISCIAACTKSEDVVNPNAEGHMALRLVSSTMTRATTPGNGVGAGTNDDNLNENKLVSADLYFFDGEGTGNAVWHHRESFSNTRDTAKIATLTIPSNIMSAIFNTSASQATLYVVANAPEGFQSPETDLPTLAALKAKVVSTDSWKTSETNATDPSSAQTSFVMAGDATVTKSGNSVSGEVFLTRAAAKIELSITDVVQSVIVGGETWTPVLGDGNDGSTIFVSLNYAVGGSYIDGAYDKAKFANDNTQQDYGFVPGETVAYNQAYPFYSYASDWGAGGANEPYLLLVVPWVKTENGSTTRQNTYYQIPVGSLDAKQIKRNHYYKVKINVGTMGSFEPQTATEITPSYTVIDWSTGSISTDIKEASYLVVDENEVVMNNVTSYGVGYQSSHDVSVSIIGFSCQYYDGGTLHTVNRSTTATGSNNIPAGATEISDVAPNLTNLKFAISVDATTKKVVLTHNLDNTMPDKIYHYFPYEITVQVTNPALPGNPEIIVFKQYPAMYVDVHPQTKSTVMVNGITTSNSTSGTQWWYLNQDINSTRDPAIGATGRDMYTVSVSAFDASTSQYIIGDPRAAAEDLILRKGDNSVQATAQDEAGNSVIKGYRATIVGSTSANIIAPKFIMASAYGAHSLNYDLHPETSGKYRCATYQEAGYPAGRWRVPTPAELEIIGQMCAEGKLASIFYSSRNTTYLSTIGGYLYQQNGEFNPTRDITAKSVRCVYDIWYWGDKLKSDQEFIWGAEGNIKDMKANGKYDQYFTPVQQ